MEGVRRGRSSKDNDQPALTEKQKFDNIMLTLLNRKLSGMTGTAAKNFLVSLKLDSKGNKEVLKNRLSIFVNDFKRKNPVFVPGQPDQNNNQITEQESGIQSFLNVSDNIDKQISPSNKEKTLHSEEHSNVDQLHQTPNNTITTDLELTGHQPENIANYENEKAASDISNGHQNPNNTKTTDLESTGNQPENIANTDIDKTASDMSSSDDSELFNAMKKISKKKQKKFLKKLRALESSDEDDALESAIEKPDNDDEPNKDEYIYYPPDKRNFELFINYSVFKPKESVICARRRLMNPVPDSKNEIMLSEKFEKVYEGRQITVKTPGVTQLLILKLREGGLENSSDEYCVNIPHVLDVSFKGKGGIEVEVDSHNKEERRFESVDKILPTESERSFDLQDTLDYSFKADALQLFVRFVHASKTGIVSLRVVKKDDTKFIEKYGLLEDYRNDEVPGDTQVMNFKPDSTKVRLPEITSQHRVSTPRIQTPRQQVFPRKSPNPLAETTPQISPIVQPEQNDSPQTRTVIGDRHTKSF